MKTFTKFSQTKLSYFSDKILKEFPFLDFNLKMKNMEFSEFYDQMKKNVNIGMNEEIKNPKLLDLIKEKGFDKSKDEIEALAQMANFKQKEDVYI